MKIGVLTWFRDSNYGTILQALAMQEYLKKEGHTPNLVNYIPERNFTLSVQLNISERLLRKYNYLNQKKFTKENESGFEEKRKAAYATIDSNCMVTEPVSSDEDFLQLNTQFDAFICGSDQIWNPYWLDSRFFLDFVKDGNKKIAYAPSLGVSTIPDDKATVIADYLKSFDSLSLREESARELIEPLVGKNIRSVCDPVYLMEKSYWESFTGEKRKIEEPYVFYYLLRYQPEHWRAIKRFAKEHHLKLVGIPVFGRQFYSSGCEKYPFAAPEDFVNYIKYADYVISDSFHATSFSVILNKQFYTFEAFRESNTYSQNSRVNSLLTLLNLTSRIISFRSTEIKDANTIDYSEINQKLADWIDSSKDYLRSSLM